MTYPTGDILHLLPESPYVCWVIRSLFSKGECEELLTDSIKNSFQKAKDNYPTYYRNNDRLVIDSDSLSQQLFEKVKPFLPETISIHSDNPVEQGVWDLKELNSRFRYCRYSAGQYFHRHLDGVYYRSERIQSKLTFMLYLNSADGFEGGRTLFYRSKDSEEIWASYLPQQGDLIIFDHNIWHEGEMLTAGEKYVLRSDILYEKKVGEAMPVQQNLTHYQEGHLGYIWKLLVFNNHLIISGGRDKVIKVWDENGVCRQRLLGHQNSILCFAQINKSTFLSGSRDRTIKVWQLEKEQFFLKTEFQIHQAVVLSLCRLHDQLFASSGGDNLIHLCTLDGEVIGTLEGLQDWVWNVIQLPGTRLASCSEDCTIKLWDYQTGECLATLREDCPIHFLVFDADKGKLISGSYKGEITIRRTNADVTEWAIERAFPAHQGIIRTLLLFNGHYLASGGEDNQVRIWDLRTGECLTEFPHTNFVQSLAINNQSQLLSASYDGQIRVWDTPFEFDPTT